MKKLKIAALAAALSLASTAALAGGTPGSCSNPIEIFSNSTTAPASLCDFENTLSACGTNCGQQRDAVYRFTAQGANATLTMTHGPGMTGVMFLIPVVGGDYCSTSNDPIAFGFQGLPMGPIGPLTDGAEYLVLVTADPDGPEDACDTFSVVVDNILPVALETFEVE